MRNADWKLLLSLWLCLVAPAWAHDGDDHNDAKKTPAPAAQGAAARTAERTVNTDAGQFQVALQQLPADPRAGEEARFAVRLTEKVAGGFGDSTVALTDAKVTAQSGGGETVAEAGGDGQYIATQRFTGAGDYKIVFNVTTADGRKFAADFPVAVVSAPLNWSFWLGLAALTLLALAALGGAFWQMSWRGALPVSAGALAVWAVGLGALWYFVGPRQARSLANATPSVEEKAAAKDGAITISQESQKLFDIRAEPVAERQVTGGLKVAATVKARPDARAVVAPQVAGKLSLREGVTIGAVVSRGEQIGSVAQTLDVAAQSEIESRRLEVAAQQREVEARNIELETQRLSLQTARLEQQAKLNEQKALANQARARLGQARRELQRAENLFNVGAVPQKRVEEARLAVNVNEQEVAALEQQAKAISEQLTVNKTAQERLRVRFNPIKPNGLTRNFPLTAPLTGIISAAKAVNGQQVEAGAEVLQIVNLSTIWLEAQVFEKDLPAVRDAPRATWTAAALPGEVYRIGEGEGRLHSIGQTVDPNTRAVPVIFEVNNPLNRLREGMFAEIAIDTAGRANVLAVPKSAVVSEQGQSFVFVHKGGEIFEKRAITPGVEGQDYYEVKTGLKKDERVAVSGIYQLRAAQIGG